MSRQPFQLVAKPAGPACNLDCKYCFYIDKPATGRMSAAVLEAYIRDQLAAQPGAQAGFIWQGGEPTLLGVDFFEEVVALQQRYANGKHIHNALQTHGGLLDQAWGEFLARHDFLVGLSIDGPAELHDAHRVDKQGKPTFNTTLRGLEILKRHGVRFNTLTVVSPANVAEPLAVYRFLKEIGSEVMQFIPLVEPAPKGSQTETQPLPRLPLSGEELAHAHKVASPLIRGGAGGNSQSTALRLRSGSGVQTRSSKGVKSHDCISAKAWGEFLVQIFDEWVSEDVGRHFVQQFDAALSIWLGRGSPLCLFAPSCGRVPAIEANGDIFACDHFITPEWKLGNLLETPLTDLVDSARQQAFGMAKADLPQQCQRCAVRFACQGECPKNRFAISEDGESGLNALCAGYKRFFTHIDLPMRTMAKLLQEGRPAADIMRMLGASS